jgi:hypothetical protein
MIALLLAMLVGLGAGAILAGAWTRRRWQAEVRALKVDRVGDWAGHFRAMEKARLQLQLCQGEAKHWRRRASALNGVVSATGRHDD